MPSASAVHYPFDQRTDSLVRGGLCSRRIIAICGITLVAMLAVLGMAVPAYAHNTDPNPDYNGCATGDYCMYNRINFNTVDGMADWDGSDQTFTGNYQGKAFALDNSGSSMWNRGTSCAIYLYTGPSWGGSIVLQYNAGSSTSNNALLGGLVPWNDSISSTHWCNNNHS